MKTLDVSKILYCLLSCDKKQDCKAFSECIGSRQCLLPMESCSQLPRCRRIKRILKQVLKCPDLADIHNIEGGD